VAFGLLSGEGARLALDAVTLRSLLALLYLIVFGSLIGYSAYVFLLKVSTPARVSTYAYVNPVVAVLLGWAFAGEPLTVRVLMASAVIIGSVVVITTARTGRERSRRERTAAAAERAAGTHRARPAPPCAASTAPAGAGPGGLASFRLRPARGRAARSGRGARRPGPSPDASSGRR